MRKLVLSLVAGAAMAAASAASATSFVGTTTGCFGAPCLTGSSPVTLTGSSGAVLTFNGGSFNVTDSGGIAPIGSGSPPVDTLGLFSLSGGSGTSTFNSPFTLFVTFTMPTGTAGAGTFMSEITGSVTDNTAGGVDIDFDNSAHLFTSDAGPFTLSVHDLSVTHGALNTPITGTIRAVPEPATWAMMLVGFAGIGFAMRRRRQPAIAQIA